MQSISRKVRTSTLFLIAAGAVFAIYGFFVELTNSQQKVAMVESGQCALDQLDSDNPQIQNENAHLFVSCGGFLE